MAVGVLFCVAEDKSPQRSFERGCWARTLTCHLLPPEIIPVRIVSQGEESDMEGLPGEVRSRNVAVVGHAHSGKDHADLPHLLHAGE